MRKRSASRNAHREHRQHSIAIQERVGQSLQQPSGTYASETRHELVLCLIHAIPKNEVSHVEKLPLLMVIASDTDAVGHRFVRRVAKVRRVILSRSEIPIIARAIHVDLAQDLGDPDLDHKMALWLFAEGWIVLSQQGQDDRLVALGAQENPQGAALNDTPVEHVLSIQRHRLQCIARSKRSNAVHAQVRRQEGVHRRVSAIQRRHPLGMAVIANRRPRGSVSLASRPLRAAIATRIAWALRRESLPATDAAESPVADPTVKVVVRNDEQVGVVDDLLAINPVAEDALRDRSNAAVLACHGV